MDLETAALFPDELQLEDGLRLPKGWRTLPLEETAEFLNGAALQKFPPILGEKTLPAIKIAQLRSGSSEGGDRVSSSLPAKYRICDGDLLFSWSGTLVVERWFGGLGALNQHLFKVTPKICRCGSFTSGCESIYRTSR